MRIASLIARYLLGLMFVIFGANGFLQFIHMPPPTGLAGQFMGAIFMSHYYVAMFFLQLVGGLLLLAGRYVPLALVLLGPVIVNIFLFHVFLAPAGLPLATLTVILWLLTFAGVRSAFSGIFQAKA